MLSGLRYCNINEMKIRGLREQSVRNINARYNRSRRRLHLKQCRPSLPLVRFDISTYISDILTSHGHSPPVRPNDKRSLGHLPTATPVYTTPMFVVARAGHGDAHENR